ncbi:MAG: prephenate dehydrogenase [Armatimonadota bacterium]
MGFRHCSILGLGLLGGSLAYDLRRAFPEMALTGIARRQATLDEAAALLCDGVPVFTQLTRETAAVREADLVVLCTPVQTIIAQFTEIAPALCPGTLVTDVGSTKRTIMNAAATALPDDVTFIGGHPMAGSHLTGLAHARAGLYQGATWALCAPPEAEDAAFDLAELVESIGARPLPIEAELHDELVAFTSHLPHVLAAALTNVVLGHARGDAMLPFIAGGYRDMTRIAAADPGMWRDICLTNYDRLLAALQTLHDELSQWQEALRAGDVPHLQALLTTAHDRRERLNRKDEG